VVEGFLLAMSVAVPMRIAMGVSRVVFGFFDPLLELLRPIPPIAVIPLTILWFGIGELSKALLIAYAQALGASRYHIFRDVVLRSALPFIVVGARVGMGMAFIVFVAAD
jgi:ABC-type nitrate/sulfonate/bicarbonate transport system permease component